MALIKGLAHCGIYVRDIAVSKAFYLDVLEFSLDEEGALDRAPFSPMATLSQAGCIVQLIENPESAEKIPGTVHLAFLVDKVEPVAELLLARGVQFFTDEVLYNGTVYEKGFRYLLFSGPDGELLELHEIVK